MINKLTYLLSKKSIRFNSWGLINPKRTNHIDFYEDKINNDLVNLINQFFTGDCTDIEIVEELDYANRVTLKYNVDSSYGNSIFLFCKLICKTDVDGMIKFYSETFSKLWVNNILVAAVTQVYDSISFVPLKKGENIIIVELAEIKKETIIGLYFENINENLNNGSLSILNNHENAYGKASVLYRVHQEEDISILEYILIPNDLLHININKNVTLSIFDLNSRITIKQISGKFNQKCLLSIYENCSEELLHGGYFVLSFLYETVNKESRRIYIERIFYKDIKNKNILKNKAYMLLSSDTKLTEYDKLCLKYYETSDSHFRPDLSHQFWEMVELSEVLYIISSGKHMENLLYNPGFKRKCFKSALDEQIVSYTITLPENYCYSKQMPLLIVFSISKYNDGPTRLAGYMKKDVITASISGRGVTLGSYIGEAAIWESISDILKTFNVDINKIYATGFSNGASAVWSQSQNHPHFFAGIFPIAGSTYKEGIKNLSNTRVINLSSKTDYLYRSAYIVPHRELHSFPQYTGLLCDNMIHNDFSDIPYVTGVLDEMLKTKLNPYPNEIIFRTEKNRHLKSYWIELGSIPYGKKYSFIKAKIIGQTINIIAKNLSEFTIKLAPQINKKHFTVNINSNHSFEFKDYLDDEIKFSNTSRSYQINSETKSIIDYRKGTGLLDVYLGPITIVVADELKRELKGLADNFSRPTTNGMDSVIAVDYPIINANHLLDKQYNTNLIVIDNNSDHPNIQFVKNICPIKTYKSHFTYNGKKYNGLYLIMQVIPSPKDNNLSILYVNCNDIKLIGQNIITRRFIIPSYLNGIHAFLNNMALVYKDYKYYSIYEWGMDLIEIQ